MRAPPPRPGLLHRALPGRARPTRSPTSAGVRVGHTTLIIGEGPLEVGKGPVRTGVTASIPRDEHLREPRARRRLRAQRRGRGVGADAGPGVGPPRDADPAHQHHGGRQGVGRRRQVDDAQVARDRRRGRRRHPAGRRVRRLVARTTPSAATSAPSTSTGRSSRPRPARSPRARSAPAPAWSPATSRPASAPARAGSPSRAHDYTLGVLVQSNFGVMRSLRVDGVPVGEVLEPQFGTPRREEQRGLDHHHRRHRRAAAVVAAGAPLQARGAGHRPPGLLRGARLGRDHRRLLDRQRGAAADLQDDRHASTCCSTRPATRSTRRWSSAPRKRSSTRCAWRRRCAASRDTSRRRCRWTG